MQKRTPDYDNVFKTMKMKHKRLFVSVINVCELKIAGEEVARQDITLSKAGSAQAR